MAGTEAAAVNTNDVNPTLNPKLEGSVGCIAIPVSPVTPFKVTPIVFPEGGRIVTAVAPDGTAMVFAPVVNEVTVIEPGEITFAAAGYAKLGALTPSVKLIPTTRFDVTLINTYFANTKPKAIALSLSTTFLQCWQIGKLGFLN